MKNPLIGIVGGAGAMGNFFKDFFENQGLEVIVSDLNTKLSNKELAKKADIVIISVPIEKTIKIIKEIAPFVKKDALLMDLTSIKNEPLKAMLENAKSSVLGCHPMFGPTNTIKNQIVIFTPGRGKKWQDFMQKIFTTAGANVKIISAKEHDKIMAVVQGLQHFMSVNLAYSLSKQDISLSKFMELQSPVYRITMDFLGRILHQDPALYANIEISNDAIPEYLSNFLKNGERLLKIIEKKDTKAFIKIFNQGQKYLGGFTKKAQEESDHIIDSLFEKISIKNEKSFWEEQKKTADMAVLGPKDTYSHLAVEKYFPKKSKIFSRTIEEVFEMVEKKRVKIGMVPIENKLQGAVSATFDNLFAGKCKIIGMVQMEISHAFSIHPDSSPRKIEIIYSHAQALAQCSEYLKKHYPRAIQIPVNSTAEAVKQVKSSLEKNVGAISSLSAGEKAKLKIIDQEINAQEKNETRFALIALSDQKINLKKEGRVSLAFTTKDEPGALLKILQEFADENINLTRIESRPSKRRFGEWVFFIDLEGSQKEKKVQSALNKIKKKTKFIKILGEW